MKPKVAILKAEGTNFDEETKWAFELAGANAQIILMSEVLKNPKKLLSFQILDIPGGFSYGDDLYSGKIWANEINAYLKEAIQVFLKKNNLVIGVCNGFQVLVRTGLLPGFGQENKEIGLIFNKMQKFECRWVRVKVNNNASKFLRNEDLEGYLPVEHGEGRFIVKNKKTLDTLKMNKQLVFKYINADGIDATDYPENPNGALESIAGICDTTGKIFGMMPHPEHHMVYYQYPNWRKKKEDPIGLKIYKNAVNYVNS